MGGIVSMTGTTLSTSNAGVSSISGNLSVDMGSASVGDSDRSGLCGGSSLLVGTGDSSVTRGELIAGDSASVVGGSSSSFAFPALLRLLYFSVVGDLDRRHPPPHVVP